ncbi:hypothetical protein K1719_039660 [Acacia pycnantha]|nr:hypothetical protein K1719_039660 [Acacia pycnantha]
MRSLSDHELVFIFGLLGNIVSFMVFLAPLPTFYRIRKNKSSEGFQSMPYVVALLSAMLMLYYGFLKSNGILIVSTNSIGCAIEAAYLIVYFIYAPRKHKIWTVGIVNGGGFGGTLIICTVAVKEWERRVHAVGWICAILNIAVFAAPLTIMRRVMKTKSVEYMAWGLSLSLTVCAATWFMYGFFTKDYYVMVPNVVGFMLGVAQLALYFVYKPSNHTHPNAHEIDHTLHDVV